MDRRQRFCRRLSAIFGAVLALASLGARAQVTGDDLLPLSEAFRLEVSRPQPERLHISWTIAEGYYLYRHRFRFETAPEKLEGGFTLPHGIVKQDPFFGETEIYRHSVAFDLPLGERAAAHERIRLKVVSQGCADIGICFPPEARNAELGVGETAVPKARNPFASTGAQQPVDGFLPAPSNDSSLLPGAGPP